MNREQRRAEDRGGSGRDARSEEFREQFQQLMLDRMAGGAGSTSGASGVDPDLLAVLREIRDNTGRIARALERD